MRCLKLLIVLLFFSGDNTFAQERRVVSGLIVAVNDKSPMSGFTVYDRNEPENGTVSDANGKFELMINTEGPVFLVLAGIDYISYAKFAEQEDFQEFVVYEAWRNLRRANTKVDREWQKHKKKE